MKEKIKRISSSTWALILALMMVVSSFSVLAATTNVNKTSSGYSAGETIYFSAGNTKWCEGNAKTVAYFYGNGDDYYAVFQSAGKDKNYLKAKVPDGTFTTMILIRYDPNNSTFNTNGGTGWPCDTGVWNRIDDITRSDSSYNLYTVTSDSLNAGEWSKYSASDPVATSVSLSSNATDGKIAKGTDLKLTATATGKVDGDVTYTFYNGSTKVGDAQTTSEDTATTTVSGLSAGDYTFTVKVTKDGYTSVTNTVQVKVVSTTKDLYLIGDFAGVAHWDDASSYKDYKFEYKNGKYVLNNVPFTGSQNGGTSYSFFRIYNATDVKVYSSTTDNADQILDNGVPTTIGESTKKALQFPASSTKKVNIEFDLEKLQITVTEVVVNCKMNAKYQISDTGSPFQDAVDDKNIATVNDDLTATGSTGLVKAVNSFKANGNTYVFSNWFSTSGTFANATSNQTTFSPTSDGDVIAQYKRQYMVTCTTPTNGTLTASATGPLAGDSYTITVKPANGYELASLTEYLGDTATYGENVTSEVVNGTYKKTALNNARYVAIFTKKEVDYSKYRLVGDIAGGSWTVESGLAFTPDGKATITLTSSGKQFKFYNTDTKKYYGSTKSDNQVVTMGTEYTTTINDNFTYRIDDTGTFIIEIVGIGSDGAPKFKVTKDGTIPDSELSDFELIKSDTKAGTGSSWGYFTKGSNDGKIVTKIITVNDGTYYFHVKKGNVNYCSGAELTLGSSTNLSIYNDNFQGIQYILSAGSYKVTYYNINGNGEGQFKIESIANPLADSVDLSPSATAVKTGNEVTLTAKINGTHVEGSNASYTYTFYEGEGENKKVGEKTTTELTASCKTKSSTEGKVSYHVVVSTDATYTDEHYPNVTLTYTDKTSETIQVDYRDKILYIAKVNDNGTLGELHALNEDSFELADGVKSVTIAVFSGETISDETVCNLTVSESKNKYTTITSSTIDTDDVAGIPTYTINCNEGASSPTIYIVDDNIYAVATFDMGATNTFDNTNTVDYYFAEPTDDTGISTTGDGLRIKYWNNSVATQCDYADVTTKVDKDGNASDSNTITVNMDHLYKSGVKGSKTFNVYKVSLPVWATSFRFVSSGTTEIPTFSTFVPNTAGDASIGLNPNRIYLLYKIGDSNYSRGVVLDSSFWTKTSSENNDVPTKNFKANAVNYNTQYNESGSVTNDFNKYLNALYDTAYANPLFFGYFIETTTQVAGNQNFRIQDNLAMRHDNNHAYYASVQGLAGNTLSSTSKNENGCGYLLTADGSGNMPLFDYDKLKLESNSNVASNVYEGLNFPFNESTFNGITTYSYDSFTDKNRVIDGDGDSKDFKVDTYSNATVGNDKGVGFFPFNNFDSTNYANKYGFGTEFDIDFYMSETGKLTAADNTKKDITFNFSGDDDVWVYVDGVLVLDLGGAHKVSSGSINFSDMQVIYKAAVDTSDNISARGNGTADTYATNKGNVKTFDLAQIFKANGAEFNNKNSSKKHTLQMFYMERGSSDSNCSISFNLPQNTGLLVRNDVNFDSVNPGLKDATMGVANKDYFSYMIENKYASGDEFTKLTGKYGTLPNKTTSENIGKFTFGDSNPLYPIVTTDNIIRRVISGTTYYLAVNNDSGNSCESYWTKQYLKDAYTGLPSINFSLPDDFAKLESSPDGDDSPAVSGQTDTNGGFNLLFNQSAKFNSKIPSNTMVKVVQNETLYKVNAGDKSTAMSVVTDADGKKVTRRNVSNFYSTSYKITDDKSQKIITEEKGNKDSNVFSNDTKAGTDGFYFADYSENHSDSSAMTVNFTNTVSTSDIKIIKKVPTDNSDKVDSKSGDRFTFTVKLSNIFGDKGDTTLKDYENLTYKVYDSSTDKLEGTRTYGKSGVSITANEYAVITGIPVGTHYEVVEKQRTGYQFASVTGEFVDTTSNSTKAATQTNGNNDTDSVDSTINTVAEKVTGNMPIANDANNAGKTVQLTYTNKEAGLTISFKYYDREVTTGTVAHINTKPTVVNYAFSVSELNEKYLNTENGTYNYAQMITDAVAAGRIDPDNVIDSYKCFTSQAQAVGDSGIKSFPSYRNYDETKPNKYKTYGEAYSNGNFKNHTDCYGRLQDSKSNDGEDWVTYYNGKTKYEKEDDAKAANAPVTSITVWFFNNLQTYKPTFHYATAKNELSPIDGTSKFVGTQLNTIKPVFYNVRLGVKNGVDPIVDPIDEAGSYLDEYGVTGYTGTYSGTAMSIQNGDGKELKFLYWSYDADGKSIASNSYKYGYRITNNIHLYAIYGEDKVNTKPGLTVSMNNPDYHIDSNGINRVRLNTVMNVYNCPDDDPNIKNVAVIYILDPNNNIQNYIDKNDTATLSNIRDKVIELIKANGSKPKFSVTIEIDGKNDKALGLTYTAGKELLTNKNRVQFTTDFKQSALVNQKIYTFSAMNYSKESATDWIVSDNCIKYIFDENGKVTSDSTQVNCLQ